MKKKLLIVTFGLLLVLTTACGKNPKLKNGEEVVASIDGMKVTADDLYKELKEKNGYSATINMIDRFIANKEIADSDEVNKYVDQAIEYYSNYAARNGMDLETFIKYNGINSTEEFEKQVRDSYKLELAIQNQIGKDFTDEEVENYYNEKYSKVLTVKHILINFDNDEDEVDEAYNTALTIIGKLKEAKSSDLTKTFDDLAFEYSADTTYNKGGLIEEFMVGDVVPEFYQASIDLKANEFTETPIKTTYGYHIILKVSEKEKPSLDSSKEKIRRKLAETKINTDSSLKDTAKANLREKYNIKIYDSSIKSAYDEANKTE